VIRAAQPVIVDAGPPANRRRWMEDVFSLVEPADVRWVFLSHDDVDHTGNLEQVMEACPNATLVLTWAMLERHTNAFRFPPERCRFVGHGESFDVGDRRLVAFTPPVYDSPTTRGLLDPRTGLYWAADAFATPTPDATVANARELDPTFWKQGLELFALGAISPWLSLVDPARHERAVDALAALGPRAIASAHGPLIEGSAIARALEVLRGLPALGPPQLPGQAWLDEVVAAAAVSAPA
jgi:flavorubredoxin